MQQPSPIVKVPLYLSQCWTYQYGPGSLYHPRRGLLLALAKERKVYALMIKVLTPDMIRNERIIIKTLARSVTANC